MPLLSLYYGTSIGHWVTSLRLGSGERKKMDAKTYTMHIVDFCDPNLIFGLFPT